MGPRLPPALGLAFALAAFALLLTPLRGGITDDSFIHLQYARNIMTRGEYSFNPGEPSFGTTSPLWVFLQAGLASLLGGEGALVPVSRAASWAAGFLSLVALYVLGRRLGLSRVVAWLATLVLACDVWLLRWTALCMETSTAALAVLVVGLASLRAQESAPRAWALGALMGGAALLRPEAYLLPVAYAASLPYGTGTVRWRRAAGTLAAFALLLAPWHLFAATQLGGLLPSTLGVKRGDLALETTSFFGGVVPMGKILAAGQGIEILLLCGALLAGGARRVLAPPFRFLAIWVVLLPAAYALLRVHVLSRYLLLVTPLLVLFGMHALVDLAGIVARRPAVKGAVIGALAALMCLVNLAVYARVAVPPSRAFAADLSTGLRGLAEYVRDHSDEGAVVAAEDIGYVAFYSRRRVLDLAGIVERETALLRRSRTYEDLVQRGDFLTLRRYPRVDYFIDRDPERDRFDGKELEGHRLERVLTVSVRTLGIRRPGPYYYTLYRVQPLPAGAVRVAEAGLRDSQEAAEENPGRAGANRPPGI